MRYVFKTLSGIWNAVRPKTEAERIEEYLSKSTDLVDLERRQKQLKWSTNPNLRGWV
mgnify:CR=1 FL=1|jgi:hypothetical protein